MKIVEKIPARKPSIANRVPGRRHAMPRESVMVMQEERVVTERDWLRRKRKVKRITMRREGTRDTR